MPLLIPSSATTSSVQALIILAYYSNLLIGLSHVYSCSPQIHFNPFFTLKTIFVCVRERETENVDLFMLLPLCLSLKLVRSVPDI